MSHEKDSLQLKMDKRRCQRQATPVHSELVADAEAVIAIQAVVVVQHPFIHMLAKRGPGHSASDPTGQAAD
jgi:hypothetical protein